MLDIEEYMEYIDHANQELLWKLAHKIPGFSRLPESSQQEMFYHLVKVTYEEVGQAILSRDELLRMNQNTLKQIIEQCPRNNTLAEKEEEYEAMTRKPVPPDISFEEKGDAKLENMDELIEEFRSKREQDMMPEQLKALQQKVEALEKRVATLEIKNKT